MEGGAPRRPLLLRPRSASLRHPRAQRDLLRCPTVDKSRDRSLRATCGDVHPAAVLILIELGAGLVSPPARVRAAPLLRRRVGRSRRPPGAEEARPPLRLDSTPRRVGPARGGGVAALLEGSPGALVPHRPVPGSDLVSRALPRSLGRLGTRVRGRRRRSRTVKTSSQTTVMLVVFDEFCTIALGNGCWGGSIASAIRTFAALAQGRDVVPLGDRSPHALGVRRPGDLDRPTSSEGAPPDGLRPPAKHLHALRRGYRLHVFESLTRLCPALAVQEGDRPRSGILGSRRRRESLVSDVSVVYLHMLPPSGWSTEWLQSVKPGGNFRGLREQKSVSTGDGGGLECARGLCDFVRALRAGPEAVALLRSHGCSPHVPWTYPVGQALHGQRAPDPGRRGPLASGRLAHDPGLPRYLLQLAYTDLELGLVLDRLRSKASTTAPSWS